MRALGLALFAVAASASGVARAAPGPRPAPRARPDPAGEAQRAADRHFKLGVALFRDGRFADALVEFTAAYDTAPHPLVLYNIASCQRELRHHAEAIAMFRRFLAEGAGKVPPIQLADAQAELDALLAMVARITVTVAPAGAGAAVLVDGAPIGDAPMPLIVEPGEHTVAARVAGRPDVERAMRVAAGAELAVHLQLAEDPPPPPPAVPAPQLTREAPVASAPAPRRLALAASAGTNARRLGKTGAPSVGIAAAVGARLTVGVDVVLVAYAVVPSVRLRLAGDALALYAVGAVPIAFSSDPMVGTFVAAGGGLGLRYRVTPALDLRAEGYVSLPGKGQATAVPLFLAGEIWF